MPPNRSRLTLILDVSGIVEKVGPSVAAFEPGDRVVGFADAFRTGDMDRGAYQTYTITKVTSTAILPQKFNFPQGASLPTAVGTATMALFDVLELPQPSADAAVAPLQVGAAPSSPLSILVWGGASTVGTMAIQLARLVGLTIIATASEKHHPYLRSLGASVLVDYHSPTAVADLIAAAESLGKPVEYAVDAISLPSTLASVLQVLSGSTGSKSAKKLGHTLPWPKDLPTPDGVKAQWVSGDDLWDRREDLSSWLFNESLSGWLERGRIVPTGYRVICGGLEGLQNALNELAKGVSGEKLVVRIE
jgi:NADPH:quinone reductase-like Zn-dependent oxidoreductase